MLEWRSSEYRILSSIYMRSDAYRPREGIRGGLSRVIDVNNGFPLETLTLVSNPNRLVNTIKNQIRFR